MPRKAGYAHFQATRDKIQATSLVNRLQAIAMGEVEATSQQVNAAKALLNKVLPDLQSMSVDMDLNGEVGVRQINVNGVRPTDS